MILDKVQIEVYLLFQIPAVHNKIVIAAVDGELTVKRLFHRGGLIKLMPENSAYPEIELESESDLVRDFNFLVENHFKTKHNLADYAELLNKSPKTISNVFSKIGTKPPSQFIQERKMLEARRLLQGSEMQVQEIAYEIGYGDIQTFSRFFKNHAGVSPSKFKERYA